MRWSMTRRWQPVVLGQAELVHLADRFASGMPKVRIQAPIDDGWTWVNDLIVDAARLADGPEYPARPNGHCKSCAFRFMCPAQSAAAAGQPAVAATPATAESPGEQAGAPAASTRARTSPGLPTGLPPAPPEHARGAGPAVALGGRPVMTPPTPPTPPSPPRPPGPIAPQPMPRAELDALLGLTLTDEQWECVSAPLEPFVIVAGAGTGKTAVMAARVLWLVASGFVAEHEVLGLTFTNKAAAELAQRVTAQLNHWRAQHPADRGEAVGEPTIATYHSFARRLIDEQGLRVGIEPGARLLSGPAVAQLAYRVVCHATGLVVTRHGPSRVAADVVRLDANLAEQTISTDELRAHDRTVIAAIDELPKATKAVKDIRDTAERRLELADLVDELRRAKQASGGLDFADHMRLCAELVRSSDELVQAMRAAYRVVLLDEYQDTSIAQRVILSTLFAGGGVTAVGDPMQAIYGWRSASVANIDAFAQHFGRDGVAPVRVLSVNRRSGTPILDAANRIAAGLRAQHPQVAELRPPAAAGCRGAGGPAAHGRRRA